MKNVKLVILYALVALILGSCAVIRPGEAALKIRYGKIQPGILMPGHIQGVLLQQKLNALIPELLNIPTNLVSIVAKG